MALTTFQCAYCGKVETKERMRSKSGQNFCSRQCAGKWRAANGMMPKRFGAYKREPPEHDIVGIRVTAMLEELFQDFRPVTGREYRAERYKLQGMAKKVGYVIDVNGHRVNIRQNECVEV